MDYRFEYQRALLYELLDLHEITQSQFERCLDRLSVQFVRRRPFG